MENTEKILTGADIITAARAYLNVRYAHQGRSRVEGLDCVGLLIVVGHDLGVTDFEFLDYSNEPDGETMERLLADNMIEVVAPLVMQVGDVLAVDYTTADDEREGKRRGLQHTAIVTRLEPRIEVIHAVREPLARVTEQPLHGRHLRGWIRNGRRTYRVPGVVVA
jgi:cell wall-associated NlpC family hydrolase